MQASASNPVVLVATWADGVFAITGDAQHHELAGRSVRSIEPDSDGGAIAIVNGHELHRRARDGTWSTIATSQLDLACCIALGEHIYVGTDDATVFRVAEDGALVRLPGFDEVDGRAAWYAGSAIIDGKRMGPPLGVRSMSGSLDGSTLLVNVHVGGIPRSTDGGVTWHPTIEIDADVHDVRVHPSRPDIAIAAAAVGLCISRDGGMMWRIDHEGLHAKYCSAVAFVGDDILVAASSDHFAKQGAIYRRAIDENGELRAVSGGGLPTWLTGIADTRCIAARGTTVAIADRGSLYTSTDSGQTWIERAKGIPYPSGVIIV